MTLWHASLDHPAQRNEHVPAGVVTKQNLRLTTAAAVVAKTVYTSAGLMGLGMGTKLSAELDTSG